MVKANSVPASLHIRYPQIVLLLILFLFLFETSTSADDPFPPTFLTAVSDQDGKVPLFWFSPHPDTSEIAYHGDVMSKGMYVSLLWHDNCVAVKMSSPSVPFYLLKSKIYISHQGAEIDTNYDFKAPFFITVNQDSGGFPQNGFLDSVFTSASGEDSLSDGEWVDAEHHLLMEDSVFWIVFHWKGDSPLSPLVGMDDSPNAGSSFWGMRRFLHFEWHPNSHNIMIRAQIVTNSDAPSDVDSFRVYGSTDQDFLIEPTNLIASVLELQSQYTDSNLVEDQIYFYRVTSSNSQGESEGSNQVQASPKNEAVLAADKEAFLVHSTSGEQISDNLTLTNYGGLPLTFRIRINMGEADWMGGSDPFGYTWANNSNQPGSESAWVDIKNRGIQIGESGDDNEDYGFFDLGFSFPFYGDTLESLRIGTDGWLSFSNIISCYTDTFQCFINNLLPWLWGPYNLLAPFWDDLKLTDSSAIYFFSNSDSAIVSYSNLYHFGNADRGPYTFQTILTPDGEITFQYLHIDDSLYSATVGIQNHDGTLGLEVFYNENNLHDSLTIKIRPSWVKIDSMEGYVQPGESKTLDLILDPLTYPRGIYEADLLIDGWDKNHQLEPKAIPLTFCIDTTTSVEWTEVQRPERITLLQNYPNPFNPLTIVRFYVHGSQFMVQSPCHVRLKIYNILGQLVRSLKDEEMMPGNYQVIWDGKDDKGKELASGIYFCQLTAGSYQSVRKMVLVK